MTPDRWRRIKEVVDVSLRLEPDERQHYLARMCEHDSDLRQEVESLIEAYEADGQLLEETACPTPHDRLLGARIGPYKIVEHIGSGGMGSVYRAVRADEVFYKEVAVKVVRHGLDVDYLARQFRRERQIMASLQHPNIATLMDGGSTPDGLPYFVMEFIRGKPINAYCDETGLGLHDRLLLFRTVCEAVEFAHRQGVVHRDIKPGNILVTSGGVAKLLDFGIAKILDPEAMPAVRDAATTVPRAMTPEYASPEQLVGEKVSPASDVYSLGVLLCELLSGRRPYRVRTTTTGDLRRDAFAERPSRLAGRKDLAGDLDNIVLMAVRSEPERRYQSAGALADDVSRYLDGRPVVARRDTITYRLSKLLRRQRVAVISSALAILVPLAIFAGLAIWSQWNEPAQPPRIIPLTTAPGREFQPSFSPDGSRIVYAASGEQGGNIDIFVQRLAGGPPLRLTTDPADDVSPVWSPDGSRIAWLRSGPKETAVFVSPATGGVHAKIADVYPNDRLQILGRHLDWSPDGKWLAAADKDALAAPFRIVMIAANDGSKRQVTFPPDRTIGDSSPAFSPNGEKLAFIRALSSGVSDVYEAPVDGGPPRRITSDNRDVASVTWTRDGRSIVFSSNRRGNTVLWRVPTSGGDPARVPVVSDNATDPAFSRDGRRMTYSQFFDDANIWRIDTAGRGPARKIISSTLLDTSPQYSPDGARIAFRSNRSGSNEIWMSDSEGRNPVQLTRYGGPLAGTPRWSPDSREIAFDGRPEGRARIYAVAASGGQPRAVTTGPGENVVPSWSRDGRFIYFASNRTGAWQVWRAAATGGQEEQVTRLGGFAAFESPDARHLYYAKARGGPGLWRKSLPAGAEEPVLEQLKPGFWGYWAVVKEGIYFVDQTQLRGPAGINFYPSATKRVRLIAPLDKPLRVGDSAFAVSPDGRYLLFSQVDDSGSDILVVDGYR